MKFAHMADMHLGGWRDPELERLNRSAFERATQICINENVDFVIISGDFFDTAMPPFDVLDFATRMLGQLKRAKIPVYTITGSHDHSPSGKTILKVFENADLIVNVSKGGDNDSKLLLNFTSDKSGAKLTGIFGKKGALEEEYYKNLDRGIEKEEGYKIFLFHSGIREFLPEYLKDTPAMPLSLLPKGFDYYAAGHIHHRSEQDFEHAKIVYPGPIFPCDFAELERFGSGGLYIVEDGTPRFVELVQSEVKTIKIKADNRTAASIGAELEEKIEALTGDGFILLIRIKGTLSEGKPTDIPYRRLSELASSKGALITKRNINALSSKEYEEIKVSSDTIENLEKKIIKEHLGQHKIAGEQTLVDSLMISLDTEKIEGETQATFESRIISDVDELMVPESSKTISPTKEKLSEKSLKTTKDAHLGQKTLSDLN